MLGKVSFLVFASSGCVFFSENIDDVMGCHISDLFQNLRVNFFLLTSSQISAIQTCLRDPSAAVSALKIVLVAEAAKVMSFSSFFLEKPVATSVTSWKSK